MCRFSVLERVRRGHSRLDHGSAMAGENDRVREVHQPDPRPSLRGFARVVAFGVDAGVSYPKVTSLAVGICILIGGVHRDRWLRYHPCGVCLYPIYPIKPMLRIRSWSSRYPNMTILLSIGAIMRDGRIVYVGPAVLHGRIFLVRPLMCGDWGIRRNKGRTLSVEPGPVRSETSLKEARQ